MMLAVSLLDQHASSESVEQWLYPGLENGSEKNLGFLGVKKNLKFQNLGFLGFFIFWSNFIQTILNFIF